MNARIPTPEVEDSDFGAFQAALLERPVDKARAVAHYSAMAAAAQRGPQHQIQTTQDDAIVGVPYRGTEFDVACDVLPADERHEHDGLVIFAVKVNGVWISSDWMEHLTAQLQIALNKMPRNA